jgi:hypothetical protein
MTLGSRVRTYGSPARVADRVLLREVGMELR